MPATYEPISTQTLGTAVSTVTLSSIPSTYTDLVLVIGYGVHPTGGELLRMRFNGDTTTNYSNTRIANGGGGFGSFRDSNSSVIDIGVIYATSDPLTLIINIFNYANSTTNKTVLGRSNTTQNVTTTVGLWRATPQAVTSIDFLLTGGNFGVGSTFTLYGIKAA
jgi:hypothetical protein